MSKKVIILALVASLLLTGCAGAGTEPEPMTSSEVPAEVSTPESETETSVSETSAPQTTVEKVEWAGKEADNPVNIEKFNNLVDRIWGNMQQHNIKPLEDAVEFDFNDLAKMIKDYKEGTLTAPDEFSFEESLKYYILQIELARRDYIRAAEDKLAAREQSDIDLPPFPSEVLEDTELQERWIDNLIYIYQTKSGVLIDANIFNSYASAMFSEEEQANTTTINSNLSYLKPSEEGISRLDFLRSLVNGCATKTYSKATNLEGWNIAPGTDSSDLMNSSTKLAQDWGISDTGISTIFFAYDYLGNTAATSESAISFRLPSADFAMLMKLFELLDNKIDGETAPELREFLDENSAEDLYHYLYYLYSGSRVYEENTDFIPTVDEDGNTALYKKFLSDFEIFAGEKAWKQLNEYIEMSKLSYQEFYNKLNNISESTLATYGIAFADGTCASLTSGNVVNDFDWTMQFTIPSQGITKTSLANIIKNYVLMVGTVTGENYSRCLDIASSGLVNRNIDKNYVFAMDYLSGSAVATITKG